MTQIEDMGSGPEPSRAPAPDKSTMVFEVEISSSKRENQEKHIFMEVK
jgi:hypothetical protein